MNLNEGFLKYFLTTLLIIQALVSQLNYLVLFIGALSPIWGWNELGWMSTFVLVFLAYFKRAELKQRLKSVKPSTRLERWHSLFFLSLVVGALVFNLVFLVIRLFK